MLLFCFRCDFIKCFWYLIKRNNKTRSCLWSAVWFGFKGVCNWWTEKLVIRRRGNVTVIFQGLAVLNWGLSTFRWLVFYVIYSWATIQPTMDWIFCNRFILHGLNSVLSINGLIWKLSLLCSWYVVNTKKKRKLKYLNWVFGFSFRYSKTHTTPRIITEIIQRLMVKASGMSTNN